METKATYLTDAWDDAENPKVREYKQEYWGKVEASSWHCVLEKGLGRVPFDPQKHSEDQKRTAVDILLTPIQKMNLDFDINRSMLAESREWSQIVLPSIRSLGISPREINGKWAMVELVPITGKDGKPETYLDVNGVVKERKTIKFLKIFNSEAECVNDYTSGNNGNSDNNTSDIKPESNTEKNTAYQFLKIFVQNVCRQQNDIEVIRQTLALNIAQQPLISKYFTVDSPETVELITQYLGG